MATKQGPFHFVVRPNPSVHDWLPSHCLQPRDHLNKYHFHFQNKQTNSFIFTPLSISQNKKSLLHFPNFTRKSQSPDQIRSDHSRLTLAHNYLQESDQDHQQSWRTKQEVPEIPNMELNTIKDAFDRVTKKQKVSSSKSQETVEHVTQEIEQALSRIQSGTSQPDCNSILGELKTKLKEMVPLGQLEATQKELNLAMTKYTKLLEKQFNPDISKSYRNVDFDFHTVNQIVASHLYREGMFDVGDCFVKESHEEPVIDKKTHFLEMYQILESMKSRDLGPALKWATANHEKLQQNGSDIELKLHRLQFMEILKLGHRDEALKYMRTYISPFSNHFSEIQKLMACLLWAGKLESSPYTELLSPTHWAKLAHELAQQFCNLLGESYQSPLSVTVAAGVEALPTLIKLANVMTGKKQEWLSMKQLPVPVDLDQEFQFHSIFVCPVSRDQASEENPPMLMSCGHVLCKQSITKLSKNNSTRPFKCPYCPTEVEVGQCRQLHF
ncbi:putative transcription factor interactor and regulator LisH family [Helianthus annuus]|nr:putative transcription factor interactor and regulator LisH family [Helianthus annuus]